MSSKHSTGYKVGIVNPLTLVGNEIKNVLRERSFPLAKVVLLDSGGKDAGALTDVGDEPAVVTPISGSELEDLDVVFFCGSHAQNHEWIERHETDGFVAVDVSQPSTIEDGVLAVAGVNLDDATGKSLLVSPHPIAIPIALILHQIEMANPVELCAATVIQPASELEQAGIDELAKQTISVLNVQSVPQTVFDRQLAFNMYPAPERNEEFIAGQLHRLIDARTRVALLITQGTIFHGHTFSLFVLSRNQGVQRAEIVNALKQNPAIAFPEGDQTFGTIDAAGRDEVLIADVRPDPSVPGGCWVWAVCDNLRRSSALNAVLVAEKALFGHVIN